MTAISTSPAPGCADLTGRQTDLAGAGAGDVSFTHALIAILDRAIGRRGDGAWGDPGADRRAEMFNEHGFFTALGQGTPLPCVTTAASPSGQDASAGEDLVQAAGVGNVAPPAATPATNDAVPPRSPCGVLIDGGSSEPTAYRPARAGPLTRLAAIAATPVPIARVASSGDPVEPASEAAATRRPAPERSAASGLRVALNTTDAGVAIAVAGGEIPDGEREVLREAVAQVLARHGLVLSELRVSEANAGARQDGGK
ncbi:hypothetical protein [uncultured Sphingomonas sp.]|uniref:hypothetical protein n=1 Tax=uncultured Sphingomonas sp. TaxID=158754 RepID=UPI0035CC0FDB